MDMTTGTVTGQRGEPGRASHDPGLRQRAGAAGFSLIELIMVIVLISILGVAASTLLFRGGSTISTGALAKKIKDDIRYAQKLAMARNRLDTPPSSNPGFSYRIRFNVADPVNCPGADQYTIVNDSNNNGTWGENPNGSGAIESARLPSTGAQYFCVPLNTGEYAGLTVSADFGGGVPGILEFDNYGIPYDSDGAKLTVAKTLTASKGTETATVTVTPYTGWVSSQ